MAVFQTIITNYTFQIVALGSGLIGLLSGSLGVFLTLRRQSLLGDALGHSALPGIAIAFIIIQEKHFFYLLLGAAVSGILATSLIQKLLAHFPYMKQDSALSLVLASFFGLGTALITYIQTLPNAAQAGIKQFIFGQASGMLVRDVKLITVTTILCLFLLTVFWKEFKLVTFDKQYARLLSGHYRHFNRLLTFMLILTIVLGLESVGVVLMSALLINPGIAARYWTKRLSGVVILAGFFGASAGIIGTFISSIFTQIPTGPAIVSVVTTFTLISLLFSPSKGLLIQRYRLLKKQQALLTQLKMQKEGSINDAN